MTQEFLRSVQGFIANAFSISILRNMGPAGTLANVRRFLKDDVDLALIGKTEPSQFSNTLDELTESLRRKLPKDAKHWGVARKCVNLFFRDALYNFYLRREFDLARFESHFEIPLDSHVGNALRGECEGAGLAPWRTVKGLTPKESAEFQAVAARVAKRKQTLRVHLDVTYWRGNSATASRTL